MQSDQQPPPQPINPAVWNRLDRDGNLMPDASEEGLEDNDDGLSSTERRLSPLGRLARWQPGGPFALPMEFSNSALTAINDGNRSVLKQDLRKSLAGELNVGQGVSRSRLSLLHLAATSPMRYASIRQVLATAAQRFAQLPGEDAWAPRRIEEHGCGVGEGAWAAAETWPGFLEQWRGIDDRGHLLRQGRDLAKFARQSATPGNLAGVDAVSFGTNRHNDPSAAGAEEAVIPPSDTLSLSAFNLLALGSDSSREQHVKQLWKHRSEAIVLIEEGTDRGFAAIASARALLLELGKEDRERAEKASATGDAGAATAFDETVREKIVVDGVEYFEELPGEDVDAAAAFALANDSQLSRGCHVVAPCPHDRPCPLLHPFKLDDSYYTPFAPAARPGHPSAMHKGSHVGMQSCIHPVQFMPPQWARDSLSEQRRRQKQKGGREHRSARFAYVVIKRGERPSVSGKATISAAASSAARAGILDELRRGDSVHRRLPEDVIGFSDDVDAAEREERVKRAEAEEQADAEAREELMRLLPAELQRAASAEGGGGGMSEDEEQAAMNQAIQALLHQQRAEGVRSADSKESRYNSDPAFVWQASADVEGAEQETTPATDTADDETTNPEWLSDMLKANGPDGGDAVAATSDAVDASPAAVSSAIAHMLPSLPRIIMPPMKKGGHVTFDACHQNGSIQRYTIARSSGRQPYQEVRKSSWADVWGQDPVEDAIEKHLQVVDAKTGLKRWVKRKGWGQWTRINPADPERVLSEEAASKASKKGYQGNTRASNRASNRPSALIGADQVCPRNETSPLAGATNKQRTNDLKTSKALVTSNNSKSGGYGLTNSHYTEPKYRKKMTDKKKSPEMRELQRRIKGGAFFQNVVRGITGEERDEREEDDDDDDDEGRPQRRGRGRGKQRR